MLAAAALISVLAPTAARADCDVPDDGTGIPEDVAFRADVGRTRAALANAGIGIGGTYYAEAFQNWGGIHDGSAYDGVLELHINADMKKLGLWKGFCFFANGYQIHGKSITADYVGALMPISSFEASPATRLFEMWFEQHLFNDKVTVKVGQLAADAEFILSEGGGYFLNGTWGWPSITAADLPSGGPLPARHARHTRCRQRMTDTASWSRFTTATPPRPASARTRKSVMTTASISLWKVRRC